MSQLAAYNLTRIRKALGLNQEQAAARLEPYLGVRWSKAVYSAAERSYYGKRVRQFTASELAAFAAAFEVPVVYFYMPPKPEDRTIGDETIDGVLIGSRAVAWADVFDLVLDGKQRSALAIRVVELPKDEWPPLEFYPGLGLGEWVTEATETAETAGVALRFKFPPGFKFPQESS
jgi:transcriptional regulator with XRE-family HTH domain